MDMSLYFHSKYFGEKVTGTLSYTLKMIISPFSGSNIPLLKALFCALVSIAGLLRSSRKCAKVVILLYKASRVVLKEDKSVWGQ